MVQTLSERMIYSTLGLGATHMCFELERFRKGEDINPEIGQSFIELIGYAEFCDEVNKDPEGNITDPRIKHLKRGVVYSFLEGFLGEVDIGENMRRYVSVVESLQQGQEIEDSDLEELIKFNKEFHEYCIRKHDEVSRGIH